MLGGAGVAGYLLGVCMLVAGLMAVGKECWAGERWVCGGVEGLLLGFVQAGVALAVAVLF